MPRSARSRPSHLRPLLAFLIAQCAAACANLHPLATGACGNDVIDGAEDCDGHAPLGGTCAAPDEPHACRWVCGLNTGCPAGYGCGGDGVCRRPRGALSDALVPIGDPVSFPAIQALAAADFDADGVTEILVYGEEDSLGRRAVRLISPAKGSSPAEVVPLPVTMTASAVARLDGDATDDVAFADVGGVTLLRGTGDLRGQIGAYPSIIPPEGGLLRTVPVDVIPEQTGDELVVLIQGPDQSTFIVRPPGIQPTAVLAYLPGHKEEDIAGNVATGRFNVSLPCPALAFAYTGGANAFVFWPCRPYKAGFDWNVKATPSQVNLPAGETIGAGLLATDLDLDGHDDLLIAAQSKKLFVAWGVGDGTFLSAKQNGTPGQAGDFALPETAGEDPGLPLAVADLDSDGIVDYVLATGILVSGGGGYDVAFDNLGAPWTAAVAADFNDNGLIDVAAASAGVVDIDFLNNAGGGLFNPSSVITAGGAEALATGDFDGDLVTDLAFSQSVDVAGVSADHLAVAFGSAHGPPGTPVDMAQFDGVREIYSAHLPPPSGAYGLGDTDALADLVVTSKSANGKSDRSFELRGSGSRVMIAPLVLRTQASAARPLALTAGQFGQSPLDMVALGADVKTSELVLFRVEPTSEITLDHVVASDPLPGMLHAAVEGPLVALHYGVVIAAGELDESGTDEVVVVAPAGSAPDGAAVVIADYDSTTFRFQPRAAQPLSLRLGVDSAISLHDADGDGALDALIVGGTHESPTDLTILWNDRHGGLDTASPSRVHLDDGVTGAACVPDRTAKGCTLFLTTKLHTYRAAIAADRTITAEPVTGLPGGIALVAGDFDHDGVVDLAVGEHDQCAIFRRLPEIE